MGALMSCFAVNIFECAACAACSCFTSLLNWSMSQAVRFSHVLIIFIVFTIAIVLGTSYTSEINDYAQSKLTQQCSSEYLNECIYRQLIYRASFSLTILFTILSILSSFGDIFNKGFWVLKLMFGVFIFMAFWWVDNSVFTGWSYVSRYISFVWLLVQGLLLLDFSHDVHFVVLENAEKAENEGQESRQLYALYLILSAVGLAGAVVGLVFLFRDYSGCGLGLFFIILTLILGVITTVLSLLNSVNRGLLTPCLMFAYSVFICWYALLSSPDVSCNPTAGDSNGGLTAIIVISIVSIIILLYCVFNGTKVLNIFNSEGEGVVQSYSTRPGDLESSLTDPTLKNSGPKPMSMNRNSGNNEGNSDGSNSDESGNSNPVTTTESSGTLHERVFFHVLMALVCCYFAMVLTSWNDSHGNTPQSANSRLEYSSLWLKIVSQWVFLLLYLRVLQVAYQDNLNENSNTVL